MASKRQVKRRECGAKAAYLNEAQAAFARNDRIERGGDTLVVYRCSKCGKFHLGHAPQSAGRTTKRLRRSDAKWILAEREQIHRPPQDYLGRRSAPTFNAIRLKED